MITITISLIFFCSIEKFALVLILLENGFWYRAKVLNNLNCHQITVNCLNFLYEINEMNFNFNFNYFQIFLVDFGTTHNVQLESLFEWITICDEFPFQATLFTISNVISDESSEPIKTNVKFLNNFISAEVKYETMHYYFMH